MIFRQKINQDEDASRSIIEAETLLEGELCFEDTVEIRGQFKGTIVSSGKIIIAEGARVYANIKSSIIILSGQVIGNCEAAKVFEMTNGASLKGNILAKTIKMTDQVQFEGKCVMLK